MLSVAIYKINKRLAVWRHIAKSCGLAIDVVFLPT